MRLRFILLIPLLSLAACASLIAETPAQRVYAAQADFNGLLAAAAAYEGQPRCLAESQPTCSDADVVRLIRLAANDGAAALKAAQDVVRTPGTADSKVTAAVTAARASVDLLRQVLVNHKIKF